MRSTPCSAITASRVWYRDTSPPYVAMPTANGTYPEWRAQAVSTRGFFFVSKRIFRWCIGWLFSPPSAVNYHKSYILRRRYNQNGDQQNWRLNHHVHRHFRSHQEPGENQEQTYDMDVMEPFRGAEQELQREKRHQKVAKHSEQEETHWLASRVGNHLQRASTSAGPEARIDRKTSPNGSQTRGQFHQHSNTSGPGPEHSWGFRFSRRSPSLSKCAKEGKKMFYCDRYPSAVCGVPSGASHVVFIQSLFFIHVNVILAKQFCVITGQVTSYSRLLVWRPEWLSVILSVLS